MELLENTTHALLAVAIILLLAIIALQAITLNDKQYYHNEPIVSSDRTGYAVHNPVLSEEMQTRIQAPGITEYNRGITTWNEY